MDLSLNKLGNKIRKLKIESRSIVLIREDTIFAKNVDNFVKILEDMGTVEDIAVVVTEHLDDAEVFTEAQMNKLGWYRLPQLKNIIKQ